MPHNELTAPQLYALWQQACAREGLAYEVQLSDNSDLAVNVWYEFARLVRDYTRSQT